MSLWTEVLPDLFLFSDACNVYVLRHGDEAIAIDFGSGRWRDQLSEIGVRTVRHVLLTHAHRDGCYGLVEREDWPFAVHGSGEDLKFFQPDRLAAFWRTYQSNGCPANYAAPRSSLSFAKGDLADASELRWRDVTVGVIPTPGHTRGALTFVVNWNGKAVAFCGDAAHADGRLHQPYHLEWDHWTGEGALAAWYGLERLSACRIDVLCPAHGPVTAKRANACVRQTQRRLMAFVKAKGSVCAGAMDRWFHVEDLGKGIVRVMPDLYMLGGNTYLLAGSDGEGMVIDPTLPSIERIGEVMALAGVERLTAATATHYHRDHSDGLNWVRENHGAQVWLHPQVAEPIRDRNALDVPWMTEESVVPDRVLPEAGTFQWNRYRFGIRPFPGQTWWHCAFDTEIFGQRVLFSGDNFQPPTRWNGTGGFCAYNGARFSDGFARSAQAVLDLEPDLICNGHGCVYAFDRDHYRRILRWAEQAENAVRDLCASASDYDPRAMRWAPFRSEVKPGGQAALTFLATNHGTESLRILVKPALPDGWATTPERKRMTIATGKTRGVRFELYVPKHAKPGRYIIAGEVEADGRLIGEAAVAIVDVM